MPTQLTVQAQIKVNGTALAAKVNDDVRSVRVETSLWVPSRCTIRIDDAGFEHTDSSTFVVGATLVVSMPKAGSATMTEVFNGEITDVAIEPGTASTYELVIGALDKSHRLAVANTVKTYANQTYTQIVQAIAGATGLTADVESGLATMPYVLQTTSDYQFLWDIALRTGCEWWVDGGKLHFKKRGSTAGQTLTYGSDLGEFRVRYSGANKAKKVTVQGWDSATQAAVTSADSGGLTSTSFPDIGGTSDLATGGRGKAVSGWAKEVTASGYSVADASEAKAVADALGARLSAAEVLARGSTSVNPSTKVGESIEIKNMGSRVSGKYLVTSVEHIVSTRVETRFTAGNRAPVGLADLVGGGGFGPSGATSIGTGIVTAVVTAVTGDPDNAGRVKLKFPWVSDADESTWARVAAPGAGNARGFHPGLEVNDEVVVAFENGDVRFPVVLGGVWSKKNAPPVTPTDPHVSRMMKSRLGHTIEVSDGDSDAKKHIELALADGANKLRIGADKTTLDVASGKELTITAGSATIKVDSSGNVSIAGGKISIKAQQDLELAGLNVKINAQANVEITANAQFKASGNAGANLETSAIAVVKGTMVKIN